MKPSFVFFLVIIFFSNLAHAKKENKLKFKVKQNTAYSECKYSGEVVLSAKYKYKFDNDGLKIKPNTDAENSFIEVLGTTDNAVYSKIAEHPITFGRGRANIVFDAGNCLADIKLQFAY